MSGLPPVSLKVGVPSVPGSYRVVARDLVGNTSAGLVKVPEPGLADPPLAGATRFALLEAVSAVE